MQARILCRLPITKNDWQLPGSWHIHKRSDGKVGIAWMSKKSEKYLHRTSVSFMQIDLTNGLIVGPASYPCLCNYLTGLRLTYNVSKDAWVVTWVEPHVDAVPGGIILLTVYVNGQELAIDPNPFVMRNQAGYLCCARADADSYLVLYLQPQFDEDLMDISSVRLGRIQLLEHQGQPITYKIADTAVVLAHMTEATCLLATCQPEYHEIAVQHEKHHQQRWVGEWRIFLHGGKAYLTSIDWERSLDMRVPVIEGSEPIYDISSGLLNVEATVIAGPLLTPDELETFVVGVRMTSGLQPLSPTAKKLLKKLKKQPISQQAEKLIHLLSKQRSGEVLNWQNPIEMMSYEGTLALVGANNQGQIVLCQVA